MPEVTNRLLNGGFEDGDLPTPGLDDWTLTTNPLYEGETLGSNSYLLFDTQVVRGGDDTFNLIEYDQDVAIPGGATDYAFSGWFSNTATDNDHPYARIDFRDIADGSLGTISINGGAGNGEYSVYESVGNPIPSGAVTAKVQVRFDKNNGSVSNIFADELYLLFDSEAPAWSAGYNQYTASRLTFAETTEIIDRAPTPKSWLLTGNAAVVSGGPYASGNSVRIIGDGDSIKGAGLPDLYDDNNRFTIYFWLKLDTLDPIQGIMFSGDVADNDGRFQLHINTSSELVLLSSRSDTGAIIVDLRVPAAGVLTAGQYHLIGIQRMARHYAVFVDGSIVMQGLALTATKDLSVRAPTQLYFGIARADNAFNSMTGNIADVWVVSGYAIDRLEYTKPAIQMPMPEGPTITTYPQDAFGYDGESVSLTVAATGSGTLLYQWYDSSGAIPGGTSATYTFTADIDADNTIYYVGITDDDGTVYTPHVSVIIRISGEPPPPRTALCWNFEDDNFTWFDAAHDTQEVTSSYNPLAFFEYLVANTDVLWVMDDSYLEVGLITVDSAGDYDGTLLAGDAGFLQQQGSFIEDGRRSTQFNVGIVDGSGVNLSPLPLSSFDFSCGLILSVTPNANYVGRVRWSTNGGSIAFRISQDAFEYTIYPSQPAPSSVDISVPGIFQSGDVIFIAVSMTSGGVYTIKVWQNFVSIIDNGDTDAGALTFDAATADYDIAQFNNEPITVQYVFLKDALIDDSWVAAALAEYNLNKTDAPTTLGQQILDPVVCMKYQFDTGWTVRWSDLHTEGKTWAQLEAEETQWNDFYSGGAEENMYWLTKQAVLLSDQVIQTNGLKEYFVVRNQIDFNEHVQEFTTDKWTYARQFYFHLKSQVEDAGANIVSARMGWANSMMDDPTWLDYDLINLQKTDDGGEVKWDFRVTGRYLSIEFIFDATQKINMTGGEINIEQTHGR